MRNEFLTGLIVFLAISASFGEEPSQAVSAKQPVGSEARNAADKGPAPEIGLTFGQGLPQQTPWMPPPFSPTTPNSPFVPLPYFAPPPPGPSPEELARIPGGSHFWGGFEYLMWWEKKAPLPANFLTTKAQHDNFRHWEPTAYRGLHYMIIEVNFHGGLYRTRFGVWIK